MWFSVKYYLVVIIHAQKVKNKARIIIINSVYPSLRCNLHVETNEQFVSYLNFLVYKLILFFFTLRA